VLRTQLAVVRKYWLAFVLGIAAFVFWHVHQPSRFFGGW